MNNKNRIEWNDVLHLIRKIKNEDYQVGCHLEYYLMVNKKSNRISYVGGKAKQVLARITITNPLQ